MIQKWKFWLVAVVLGYGSAAAWSDVAVVPSVYIKQIMNTDGNTYGACMALLSESPQGYLASCGAGWVTFSCTGDLISLASANRMYETAKMAYALDKPVRLLIDSNRTHNGFCLAFDMRIK